MRSAGKPLLLVLCLYSKCVCRHEGLWGSCWLMMASKGENCHKSNMWPLAYCLTSNEPPLTLLSACRFHTALLPHLKDGHYPYHSGYIWFRDWATSLLFLWSAQPSGSRLPAMPSVFEDCEQSLGALYRSNSAKGFWWRQKPSEQRPQTRFHAMVYVFQSLCF